MIAYGDLILLAADRPDGFPKHWQIAFSSGVMTVDYELPYTDRMPSVKAVKYAASRDAFETVELPEGERDRLYAEAMYQSCLAVLHLLFASDEADAIRSIAFNGWVNFIDRMKPARACIMTVQATKQAFCRIDLSSVDPLACFKALNGVASASAEVVGSGDVGPEAIVAGSSPGTSEMIRATTRAGAAAAASRPPLIAERCLRTQLISAMPAPLFSNARLIACLSERLRPGAGSASSAA